MTFVPLYTQKKVTIKDVKYYRYYEKQVLPFWMTFLPAKGQLLITVDKKGVINDFSTEKNGENIIVLEALIEVEPRDLMVSGLIDENLAKHLLEQLKNQGYLDNFGKLTSKLESKGYFYLDFFDNTYKDSMFTND